MVLKGDKFVSPGFGLSIENWTFLPRLSWDFSRMLQDRSLRPGLSYISVLDSKSRQAPISWKLKCLNGSESSEDTIKLYWWHGDNTIYSRNSATAGILFHLTHCSSPDRIFMSPKQFLHGSIFCPKSRTRSGLLGWPTSHLFSCASSGSPL